MVKLPESYLNYIEKSGAKSLENCPKEYKEQFEKFCKVARKKIAETDLVEER